MKTKTNTNNNMFIFQQQNLSMLLMQTYFTMSRVTVPIQLGRQDIQLPQPIASFLLFINNHHKSLNYQQFGQVNFQGAVGSTSDFLKRFIVG